MVHWLFALGRLLSADGFVVRPGPDCWITTSSPAIVSWAALCAQQGCYDLEPGALGGFTDSRCHKIISRCCVAYGPKDHFDSAFEIIWRMEVPLKVKVFRWRCFNNKVATKDALAIRVIIFPSTSMCVFCSYIAESSTHSLLNCYNINLVWREIVEWIGLCNHKAGLLRKALLYGSLFVKTRKLEKERRALRGWLLVGLFGWAWMGPFSEGMLGIFLIWLGHWSLGLEVDFYRKNYSIQL